MMEYQRKRIFFVVKDDNSLPNEMMSFLEKRGYEVKSARIKLRAGKIGRYIAQQGEVHLLKSQIESFDPAIIVFHDENSRAGFLAILRANRSASKPIVWFRGAIGGYNALSPIDRYLLRHRDLVRLVVRSYAMINNWNGSPALRSLIRSERLACVHHFVEPPVIQQDEVAQLRAKWGLKPDDIVIGSIANARPIKNIAFALSAVSQLTTDVMPHFLYLGAFDNKLRSQLESLYPGKVIMPGPIAHAGRYASMFDIFVSPTREPGEGFGLAIAEAMASGVPVVATQFGGATDLVSHGETGFLLPMRLTSWTNALTRLVNHPALRTEMGAAGRKRIKERFSLNSSGEQFIHMFEEIVAEKFQIY